MTTLRLGATDHGRVPADRRAFFSALHESGMDEKFRAETNHTWVDFTRSPGRKVERLQEKLAAAGFLPDTQPTGVFDYRTQSAVRLFQEVVRAQEGLSDIGKPDAAAGTRTDRHLDRWLASGQRMDWSQGGVDAGPWYRVLEAVRDRTRARSGPLEKVIEERWRGRIQPDTVPAAEWNLSRDSIHLIGIRRGATEASKVRLNNDLFVLLAGGGVFLFFGSTDPSPKHTSSPPFLVPGQHLYRFGWHKISQMFKSYRGFRPRSAGVLVMRAAWDRMARADLKDERVLAQAVEEKPNRTINIHWSGRHTASWSAGCQVMAGGGYIDHRDQLIDCWPHASANYGGLATGTRGAYCVLLDLITVLSPNPTVAGGDLLHYTLLNERDLELEPALGAGFMRDTLRRGLSIIERYDRRMFAEYGPMLQD